MPADESPAAMIERGRSAAIGTGSLIFQSISRIVEAKLALRLDRIPSPRSLPPHSPNVAGGALEMRLICELRDMWMGLALLLEERSAEAIALLQRCTASMRAGDRIVELPTALVYLAEAAARTGEDSLADSSADAAVAAADTQGSDHLLLQALSDFPTACATSSGTGTLRKTAGARSPVRWPCRILRVR